MTNADVNLCYLLWELKGTRPNEFAKISRKEKTMLKAFVEYKVEKEEEWQAKHRP